MKSSNIIFFIGGAVIGALGGFFGAKAHYEKLYKEYADETIQEMKEVLYGAPDPEEPLSEEEKEEINPVQWTDEKAEEVRQRLTRNREGTNYAAIYGKVKHKEDTTNGNYETTDDEDHEDSKDDGAEAEDPEPEVIARHEENKGRKPHLISLAKVRDLPDGIDIHELQFYDEDEVLADGDTEERIDDVQRIVGDCLTKYDFVNSEEPSIYVMNEELDVCYEVIRVQGSYEETHPDE